MLLFFLAEIVTRFKMFERQLNSEFITCTSKCGDKNNTKQQYYFT